MQEQTTGALQQLKSTLSKHSKQFEKILAAILDTKTMLETKIDAVTNDVNLLGADHHKLTDRVGEVESSLTTICPKVSDLQKQPECCA